MRFGQRLLSALALASLVASCGAPPAGGPATGAPGALSSVRFGLLSRIPECPPECVGARGTGLLTQTLQFIFDVVDRGDNDDMEFLMNLNGIGYIGTESTMDVNIDDPTGDPIVRINGSMSASIGPDIVVALVFDVNAGTWTVDTNQAPPNHFEGSGAVTLRPGDCTLQSIFNGTAG